MEEKETIDENQEEIGTVEIPPVTGVFGQPWSMQKLLGLMAVFGPAAIVASVSIGAGETIVVVRTGAWARYDLLWLVLISCIVKGVFLTYLLGRYTAVSGEYLGHRLVRLPGPRGWFLLMIMLVELIGGPMAWVPIAKPCADLFHFLLNGVPQSIPEPIWENIFTSAFIGLALLLSLKMSYNRLEKQQVIICLILVTGTIIGTLMVRPNLWEAFIGSVNVGHLPPFPEWTPDDARQNPLLTMATTFAYVGGGAMGYIVYANWIGLHRWGLTGHQNIDAIRDYAFKHDAIDYLPDAPEQVSRLRQLVAPLRWDAGMGAVVLFIVTAAFMISGAAVLYPLESRFEGWSLLTEQAHVWSNIHPSLVWVYYICIIAALWGTLQAVPEVLTRVSHEFLEALWPSREWPYSKIQRFICAYFFVSTFIVIWTDLKFDILTQIAGTLGNFAISFVMVLALRLNSKLPSSYRTHRVMWIGGFISALIQIAFAGVSIWSLGGKIFSGGQ